MSTSFNTWMYTTRVRRGIPLAVMAKDFGMTPVQLRNIEVGREEHTERFEDLVKFYFRDEPKDPPEKEEEPELFGSRLEGLRALFEGMR